ncbi:hypothetical protein BK011_02790 [Tenericutes bacterium MZ-XQ]|nr:hypothetical protein BK011_02790 [Tenericutes bacterium MZ-XQ]
MKHAVKWIKKHARPLELSLYRFYFEQGSENEVVEALKSYQNEGGGFGHGLEPDFLNPNSNPIDCWAASKIIDEIGLSIDHPMVIKLVKYLKTTPHKDDWMFHYNIPSNNLYPHAPWWHYEDQKAISGYNPTASLLGFLFNYMDLKDKEYPIIIRMIEQAMTYFIEQEDVEMHELKCFNELYDYIYLDMNVKKFESALAKMNLKTIEKEHDKWFSTYCAKPLQVITSEQSPGFAEIKDLIKVELTFSAKNMHQDGYIEVLWSWSNDLEVFEVSKKAWQGILTVELLKNLKSFDVTI